MLRCSRDLTFILLNKKSARRRNVDLSKENTLLKMAVRSTVWTKLSDRIVCICSTTVKSNMLNSIWPLFDVFKSLNLLF